jgi:hypothetical protein
MRGIIRDSPISRDCLMGTLNCNALPIAQSGSRLGNRSYCHVGGSRSATTSHPQIRSSQLPAIFSSANSVPRICYTRYSSRTGVSFHRKSVIRVWYSKQQETHTSMCLPTTALRSPGVRHAHDSKVAH